MGDIEGGATPRATSESHLPPLEQPASTLYSHRLPGCQDGVGGVRLNIGNDLTCFVRRAEVAMRQCFPGCVASAQFRDMSRQSVPFGPRAIMPFKEQPWYGTFPWVQASDKLALVRSVATCGGVASIVVQPCMLVTSA